MSQNQENISSEEKEARLGDIMEWLREQPEYSEGPAPSITPQPAENEARYSEELPLSAEETEARWGDVMEWLREQPEYSEEPAPSAALQTGTGKFSV